MINKTVLTVSQLNRYVKSAIESDPNLSFIFVVGEISNFKAHYASGHWYFSLKDDCGLIRSVMFRSNAAELKWMPEDGMRVVCLGRVSLYEKDGQYQFYVENMQPDGLGALSLAAEQLRKKLSSEGLFDEENKQTLPQFPERIAVVTSDTGAAVRDIISVLDRRWPVAEIVMCPVLVQGESAAEDIAKTLGRLARLDNIDLIILGRGGGSASDLQAFNEEVLVRAVAVSPIPIISAVGHETDYTLCDLAADLRAPTPSAAAELAVPDISVVLANVMQSKAGMTSMMNIKTQGLRSRLDFLKNHPSMKSPLYYTGQLNEQLDRLSDRLRSAYELALKERGGRLSAAAGRLNAMSPLAVLSRGYAAVFEGERSIKSVENVEIGQEIKVRLHNGNIICNVTDIEEG